MLKFPDVQRRESHCFLVLFPGFDGCGGMFRESCRGRRVAFRNSGRIVSAFPDREGCGGLVIVPSGLVTGFWWVGCGVWLVVLVWLVWLVW